MVITVLRRYDINGAWTHDQEIKEGIHQPADNSMWRVHFMGDVSALFDRISQLERENTLLKLNSQPDDGYLAKAAERQKNRLEEL